MNAYTPSDIPGAVIALASLPLVLLAGRLVIGVRSAALARSLAWLMVVAGVSGMEYYTVSQPAGFRMLAIIGTLLCTMKVVVATEVQLAGKARLGFWQWIAFAGLWVGMRPSLFTRVPRSPRANVAVYLWQGAKNLALGLALVLAARGVWLGCADWPLFWRLLLSTILLMLGLSLMLHFGAFNLLTGCWRWLGAECDSVFRAPLKSRSLTEFWGKRWNLAFSEMTTLAVFRPMRNKWGQRTSILAAFLFSGLLHELAISVPVRAGFGWPLLYFALHSVGMQLESQSTTVAKLLQSMPLVGRLWTMAWVLCPLPILFHQPFLRGCIWPLIGIEA